MPYFCLADHARELGVTKEDASHLLSIIGIVNTLSRIIWGYVSDKPWINRLWIYNISLVVCGIGKRVNNKKAEIKIISKQFNVYHFLSATIASIFCDNFETLAIYSAVFGFSIGAYVALRSVILVDLLGLEKLNNAFGLLMLFEGIATFIGPKKN